MSNLKFFKTPDFRSLKLSAGDTLRLQAEWLLWQFSTGMRIQKNYALLGTSYAPLRPVVEFLEKEGLIQTVESQIRKPKKFLGIQYKEGEVAYWYEVTKMGHEYVANMRAFYNGVLKNFEIFGHTIWNSDANRYQFGMEALSDIYVQEGESAYNQFLQGETPFGKWKDYRVALIQGAFGQENQQDGILTLYRFMIYFAALEEIVPDNERVIPQIGEINEDDASWVNQLMFNMIPAISSVLYDHLTWENLTDDTEAQALIDAAGYANELLVAGRDTIVNIQSDLKAFLDENRSVIEKYEPLAKEEVFQNNQAAEGETVTTTNTTTTVDDGDDWYVSPVFVYDPYFYEPYYFPGIFIW